MELQRRVGELREQGLGLAVITYDKPEVLARFSDANSITFPMLSDEGSATIKAYGILNPVPELSLGPNRDDPAGKRDEATYVSIGGSRAMMIGVPFPGTFMLDRQGRVTSRFFEDSYMDRNTVSSVLMRVGAGRSVAGTKISSGQLDIVTYPSDSAVAPGNRITLARDVTPGPGMHVYAPGATQYRVIAVRIEPQPFVRALPVEYPASEVYHFKPLDERVPVYQKPFTLLQDVIVEGTPQAQAAFRGKETLALYGTLEYQACDDKVCYNPASVPLSWTLEFRPLLRGAPRPQ